MTMLIGVKKKIQTISFFLFKKQNQNQKKKITQKVDIAIEQKAWPSFINVVLSYSDENYSTIR